MASSRLSSSLSTLHRYWRKQNRQNPIRSDQSLICPSSRSCWNDWSASSFWDTSRTMICFSRRINRITQRRRPFSESCRTSYQRWIPETYWCWQYYAWQVNFTVTAEELNITRRRLRHYNSVSTACLSGGRSYDSVHHVADTSVWYRNHQLIIFTHSHKYTDSVLISFLFIMSKKLALSWKNYAKYKHLDKVLCW